MDDSGPLVSFEWTAGYAIGVAEIDRERQQLFALARHLHQAMVFGKGKEILASLLASLLDCADSHFAHEEQLLERIAYPRLAEHRRQHEELRGRVLEMQRREKEGETTMTIELAQFLTGWLERHVGGSDLQIREYLQKAGAAFRTTSLCRSRV